jgi:hypothetical protein
MSCGRPGPECPRRSETPAKHRSSYAHFAHTTFCGQTAKYRNLMGAHPRTDYPAEPFASDCTRAPRRVCYTLMMRDERIEYFRSVLDALLESLEATAQISQSSNPDEPPGGLQETANKLLLRLGAANRLASARIVAPPPIAAKLLQMRRTIQRLDAAYVQYRAHLGTMPAERARAGAQLGVEIQGARTHVMARDRASVGTAAAARRNDDVGR